MLSKSEKLSKITGENIEQGRTVIAAYLKSPNTLRVFFESRESLRELKIDCYLLLSELIPLQLQKKDPKTGAKKNRKYFITLEKASEALIKIVSSEDADRIFDALFSAEKRPLEYMWSKVIKEFRTDEELNETALLSVPLL